jgi:hypothetical protein
MVNLYATPCAKEARHEAGPLLSGGGGMKRELTNYSYQEIIL